MGEPAHWIVMPFMNLWSYTKQALEDCLAQDIGNVKILAISNGSDPETDAALQLFALQHPNVFAWYHNPPLPSLAATWNLALDFVFQEESMALVVNNDVRLAPHTYGRLLEESDTAPALFVSATGVTEEQFIAVAGDWSPTRGGPDFSCFLIRRPCHRKYRFDENFTPAYCEDLDFHRRMLLGGDKDRIYSINLPFLHYASETVKSFSKEQAERFHAQVTAGSRAYYERKWGGGVNQETTIEPFSFPQTVTKDCGCITTPELQFCTHDEMQGDLADDEEDAPEEG